MPAVDHAPAAVGSVEAEPEVRLARADHVVIVAAVRLAGSRRRIWPDAVSQSMTIRRRIAGRTSPAAEIPVLAVAPALTEKGVILTNAQRATDAFNSILSVPRDF
jgi:hypothetical protein